MGLSLIIKRCGRVPIFVMGAFINLAVILVLRLWMPNPDEAYVFFVIAALWGISDAIWQTQINGMFYFMHSCIVVLTISLSAFLQKIR